MGGWTGYRSVVSVTAIKPAYMQTKTASYDCNGRFVADPPGPSDKPYPIKFPRPDSRTDGHN